MASVFSESVCIGDIDFKGLDLTKLNDSLLMSLLEESQGEENDDERLRNLIRSLEAEINPDVSMDGSDSSEESETLNRDYYEDDIQLFSVDDMDGQSFFQNVGNDPNIRWADEEMVPSSPSDDMNWCIEVMDNERDNMLEFEGFGDYYQICNETILEDHAYGSLWQ